MRIGDCSSDMCSSVLLVFVVDPMLATGHSAAAAVTRLKEAGASQIKFVCLLTVPEGLRVMQGNHPDVTIFTCAVDRQLDEHGYIRPGLGEIGSATCRARVCQYVYISVVAVAFETKNK